MPSSAGGWNQEVQDRLDERKREKLQLETDIEGIEFKLKLGQIRVSDDVLHYMADHLQEALTARHPDYARRLIQMVVPKAELFKEKLRLYYSPEILMETLTLSGSEGKSVIWTLPPWEVGGAISNGPPQDLQKATRAKVASSNHVG